MNHEEQKERARAEAMHHAKHSNVSDSYSPEDWAELKKESDKTGHNGLYFSDKEYSGPGANGKEYADVEAKLKKAGSPRHVVYNKKHDMYE